MSLNTQFPMTHQELFRTYIDAHLSIISEFSGESQLDRGKLRDWAEKYSAANGVNCPDWAELSYYDNYWAGCEDPWESHEYCRVCGECLTCNIRNCRDGGPHPPKEKQ